MKREEKYFYTIRIATKKNKLRIKCLEQGYFFMFTKAICFEFIETFVSYFFMHCTPHHYHARSNKMSERVRRRMDYYYNNRLAMQIEIESAFFVCARLAPLWDWLDCIEQKKMHRIDCYSFLINFKIPSQKKWAFKNFAINELSNFRFSDKEEEIFGLCWRERKILK